MNTFKKLIVASSILLVCLTSFHYYSLASEKGLEYSTIWYEIAVKEE